MSESNNAEVGQQNSGNPLRKFLIAAVCGVGLMAFGAVWFLPEPATTDKPVTYSPNEDGSLAADSEEPDATTSLSAAQISATNNFSSTGTAMNSGQNFFPSDSVYVINQSDDLIMKRAADRLVEMLKEKGGFKTVKHFPAFNSPEPGELKADLYAILDLQSMSQTGIASEELEAEIRVLFGSSVADSNHSYGTTLDPPLFQFTHRAVLSHKSTLTGVESSGSRGATQGNSIGEAIAKRLLKELGDRRDEEKPMPNLPEGFYPDYEPTPTFEFLSQFDPEQKLSFHGCCVKNVTFWLINEATPKDLAEAIKQNLGELGWRGGADPDNRFYRMSKGPQSVEVYVDQSAYDLEPSEPAPFWIRYRHVLSLEERSKVFGVMLAEDEPDTDLLVALRRFGNREQRDALLDLIEKNPPRSFDAWFELASRYFERGEKDKAIAALQCADIITQMEQGDGSGRVRELLRKNDIDASAIEPSRSALETLRFRILSDEGTTFELPIKVGQPLAVALANADGKFSYFGMKLKPAKPGSGAAFSATAFKISWRGGSWVYSSTVFKDRPWEHRFGDNGRHITLKLSDDHSKVTVLTDGRGGRANDETP